MVGVALVVMLIAHVSQHFIRRCPQFPATAAAAATACLSRNSRPVSSLSLTTPRFSNSIMSSSTPTPTPKPPYSSRSFASSAGTFELTDLGAQVSAMDAKRQEAYDLSRKIQVAILKARNSLEQSLPTVDEDFAALSALIFDNENHLLLTDSSAPRTPRHANLSYRMEDYMCLLSFRHFLQTGTLLEPPTATTTAEDMVTDSNNTANSTTVVAAATDEEYLAGAVMGLAQDLQRYGLGRATVRDVDSVQAAKNLVEAILDYLLQLDFRNGPLRRKYDGCKYCLKALETFLYELSITGAKSSEAEDTTNDTMTSTPQKKRAKQESTLLPNDALRDIKQRMEHRDELRETLIKKCRDGQKAAKQAIFALHRGDVQKANELMSMCETLVKEHLMPIVEQEPPLRQQGSLAGVLEEYVEAKLFAAWLQPAKEGEKNSPSGTLLHISDFELLTDLDPKEYLGGLCDLTGEVGRYAVQRGTARDVDGVRLCLQTNASILAALQLMESLPGGVGKKLDMVRRSVEKLERMLYEMSLSEAAGGRPVQTDVVADNNGGDVPMKLEKE